MTDLKLKKNTPVQYVIGSEDLETIIRKCMVETIENYITEMKTEKQKWVNTKKVAEIFNVSVSTVHRWKKKGMLSAKPIGGKDYFSMEDIDKLKIA